MRDSGAMSFSYEGPDGTVTVSGEGQTFTVTDDFNRADGGSGMPWATGGGTWGISPSRPTEKPVGSLTGRVVRAGNGQVIGPFNGWPQVVVPDGAVDGDIVTWEFRGGEVISVRIGDPPADYDEDY